MTRIDDVIEGLNDHIQEVSDRLGLNGDEGKKYAMACYEFIRAATEIKWAVSKGREAPYTFSAVDATAYLPEEEGENG